jgi:RNA polymerase sigma factor (sigma-70 family)
MNMIEDAELLRRFASKRTEEDFSELVKRHLNLVYSAALRQVGGDHQFAEEVSQSVFADLARKASAVSDHKSLAAWLYTSAHFAAAKVVRGEQRRRLREQEAHHMHESNSNSGGEPQWEQLQPVIDDAMYELPEPDRAVILERFFEKKPFLQIGAKLGLTENAARMRVERALEKLREILASRGVASTSVALAAVLGAQAVSAAPVALSATVVGTSLAAAAGGAATAWSFFTAANLKVAVPVVCAVAAIVALLVQNETLNRLTSENIALRVAQQVSGNIESPVASEVDADEAARLKREKLELLKLRGEIALLRREMAEMKAARAPGVVSNETAEVEAQNNQSPQIINVAATFYLGTDEALEFFQDNSTGVVEPSEMSKLLKHLRESDKVKLLASQQVTTLSGRQAQVQSLVAQTNSQTGAVTESGHVVDVLPVVQEDGGSVKLTVIASKCRDRPVVTGELGGVIPLSVINPADLITANAVVWDGQTVVMARMVDGKKLVVFVTTTLLDQAGNRVHPDTSP